MRESEGRRAARPPPRRSPRGPQTLHWPRRGWKFCPVRGPPPAARSPSTHGAPRALLLHSPPLACGHACPARRLHRRRRENRRDCCVAWRRPGRCRCGAAHPRFPPGRSVCLELPGRVSGPRASLRHRDTVYSWGPALRTGRTSCRSPRTPRSRARAGEFRPPPAPTRGGGPAPPRPPAAAPSGLELGGTRRAGGPAQTLTAAASGSFLKRRLSAGSPRAAPGSAACRPSGWDRLPSAGLSTAGRGCRSWAPVQRRQDPRLAV